MSKSNDKKTLYLNIKGQTLTLSPDGSSPTVVNSSTITNPSDGPAELTWSYVAPSPQQTSAQTLAGIYTSDAGSTTTFSGGNTIFTGDGSGFQGNVSLTNGAVFAMNTNQFSAENIIVNAGTKLRGTGTGTANANVINYGKVQPGGSVGSVPYATYTCNSTAVLGIEFNSSAASQMNVSGTTFIDGTLQLIPETPSVTLGTGVIENFALAQGSYSWPIITTGDTANGVQGQFQNVLLPQVAPPGAIACSLSYSDEYDTLMLNLNVSTDLYFETQLVGTTANYYQQFRQVNQNGNPINDANDNPIIGNATSLAYYLESTANNLPPNPKAELVLLDHTNATESADSALTTVSAAIGGGQTTISGITYTGG